MILNALLLSLIFRYVVSRNFILAPLINQTAETQEKRLRTASEYTHVPRLANLQNLYRKNLYKVYRISFARNIIPGKKGKNREKWITSGRHRRCSQFSWLRSDIRMQTAQLRWRSHASRIIRHGDPRRSIVGSRRDWHPHYLGHILLSAPIINSRQLRRVRTKPSRWHPILIGRVEEMKRRHRHYNRRVSMRIASGLAGCRQTISSTGSHLSTKTQGT